VRGSRSSRWAEERSCAKVACSRDGETGEANIAVLGALPGNVKSCEHVHSRLQ
jgi:hypothetical protein